MDEESLKPSANPDGLVAAVFARDEDEARQYCELLDDHDIPAVIGDKKMGKANDLEEAAAGGTVPAISRGVPVLVPEVLLDEAGEVIADHDDTSDFRFDDDELEDDDEFEFTQDSDKHVDAPFDDDDDDDEPFDDDGFLDDEDV